MHEADESIGSAPYEQYKASITYMGSKGIGNFYKL